MGDRQFALSKLRQLWESGWRTLVIELVELRKDWSLDWTNDGPMWRQT